MAVFFAVCIFAETVIIRQNLHKGPLSFSQKNEYQNNEVGIRKLLSTRPFGKPAVNLANDDAMDFGPGCELGVFSPVCNMGRKKGRVGGKVAPFQVHGTLSNPKPLPGTSSLTEDNKFFLSLHNNIDTMADGWMSGDFQSTSMGPMGPDELARFPPDAQDIVADAPALRDATNMYDTIRGYVTAGRLSAKDGITLMTEVNSGLGTLWKTQRMLDTAEEGDEMAVLNAKRTVPLYALEPEEINAEFTVMQQQFMRELSVVKNTQVSDPQLQMQLIEFVDSEVQPLLTTGAPLGRGMGSLKQAADNGMNAESDFWVQSVINSQNLGDTTVQTAEILEDLRPHIKDTDYRAARTANDERAFQEGFPGYGTRKQWFHLEITDENWMRYSIPADQELQLITEMRFDGVISEKEFQYAKDHLRGKPADDGSGVELTFNVDKGEWVPADSADLQAEISSTEDEGGVSGEVAELTDIATDITDA